MNICDNGHEQICYNETRCPLCRYTAELREIFTQKVVDALQEDDTIQEISDLEEEKGGD